MKGTNSKKFVGMDIGSSKIVICMSKEGIIFNEPAKIAYDTRTNDPYCIGKDADELDGKTSEMYKVVRPVKDGIISDFSATEDFLRMLTEKLKRPNLWKNALVLLGCPSGITQLERSSLKKIAIDMGANYVIVKESIQLAAMGAGIDFYSPKGNIVVDIGNGTTDVAVISAGDAVISKSVFLSSDSMTRSIMLYVRKTYNAILGDIVIEDLKIKLGCLKDYEPPKVLNVMGRDAITGLPKEIQISSTEVFQLFKENFVTVTDVLIDVLEKTPPNLTQDVIKNGLTLVGGMSQIKGIRDFLEKIFRFKVNLIQKPELAVINGIIKLENEIPKLMYNAKIDQKNDYDIKEK